MDRRLEEVIGLVLRDFGGREESSSAGTGAFLTDGLNSVSAFLV